MRKSPILHATKIALAPADAADPKVIIRDPGLNIDAGSRVRHRSYGLGAVTAILPFAGSNDGAAEVNFDCCGSKQVQTIRLEIAA